MISRTVGALVLALMSVTCSASATGPGNLAEIAGFHACSKTVDDLATIITKGTEHWSFATTSHVDSDGHLFNAVVPSVTQNGGISVSIINVAPTSGGTCDGTYTTVFVGGFTCKKLEQDLQHKWKPWGEKLGDIVVLENGPASIVLVPRGADCLVLTTDFRRQ